MILVAATSYYITKNDNTHKCCLPIYALVLVGLALPPLFTEGAAMYELSRWETSDILEYCDMTPEELREKTGKFGEATMRFVHHFDQLSDSLLDKNMCTKTCPCYSDMDETNENSPRSIYLG